MTNILAYDRMGTVRTTDVEGRLRVAKTPISKANICPYMGREIPEGQKLGLDPERIYQMLRDPDELKKAAPSFNGLPVLEEHFHVTAANPRRDLVVGTTGNEAAFDAPYLMNSLVVWDGEAISRIKTGEQRELSSAYRYTADMTPGEYEGQKYDGVMRDIVGSHVAVVPTGRAGPDVLVADSQMESTNMKYIPRASRRAMFAKLRPFLAQDADMDAARKALDCDEMGKDDACETLRNLLGGRVPDEIMDQVLALFENASTGGALNTAQDSDEAERREKLRAAGLSDDEIDKVIASLADVAEDDDDDFAEMAEKMRKAGMSEEDIEDCRALCAPQAAQDDEQTEADRAREAAGASEADKARAERERKDRRDEAEGARRADEERAERERRDRERESAGAKAAMDAAISKAKSDAVAETMAAMRDLHTAQDAVKPFVGAVAMDSAEGVYRFTLRQLGYDLSGIPATAYRSMFDQHARRADSAKRPTIAADSKAGLGLLDKFPGLKAVKIKG
ncbi:DUF2213 domain-containing protein [Komagataeibacter intermedius]|uniref:DUF2213 domain-containing protein n=1 Tax=Komagataeibacter intermedius NRIC 0521 TaxID=1307934 RepID=A0ABQ0PGM4_9PROT|nr:DUF2213 domain-containing protein [Komagataeibacter intermedius]GAN86351.1 hypothetical protein Gain_0027_026 [Komagataeibacter intermedius TF2]GBQ67933.1 hypothetical protein AA0521_1109 [Komagataeibacter intermedius NRIC 0521]